MFHGRVIWGVGPVFLMCGGGADLQLCPGRDNHRGHGVALCRVHYSRLHKRYHPRIRDFLESFGYNDIFLFDPGGNLVYSVFKETEYATNFLEGPHRQTNLASVYRQALQSASAGSVFIADFKPYAPSYGAPVFHGRVIWGVGPVFLMCGQARTRIDTNTRDPGIICAAP